MKVERLRVERFGRLVDLDTGPAPLPGLVVALGPNEAGKSTLFHFLTTLLYGFYPASREGNPYTPWEGGDAAGAAVLRLDDGRCMDVERRLRSQPTGSIRVDGTTTDLRNRTLPCAAHVPLAVFEQVFAVGLADLAGLEEETWNRVQDRLIGAMGATDLRPARAVADDLETEAGRTWRPTRHGNQRLRDLKAARQELAERRRDALEGDRRLREAVREHEDAVRALETARRERERERLARERVEALAPVRTQRMRIAELRREAGDLADLADLPADPGRALARLDDRLQELDGQARELEAAREAPSAAVAALGDAERRLLDRRDDVETFVGRVAATAPERARMAELAQEIRDLDRRLADTAGRLMAVPWEEVPAGPLHALPVTELRGRLRHFRRAREQRRIAEAARPATPDPAPGPSGPPAAVAVAALVVGVALVAAGATAGPAALLAAGGALAAVGLTLLALRPRPGAEEVPAGPDDGGAERMRAARRAEEEARASVAALLREIPVDPAVLDEPDEGLPAGLERLQELVRDRRERERTLAGLRDAVGRVDRDARTLAAILGQDPELGADALASVLERELRRAERLDEAARAAARELERLDRNAERLAHERTARAGERDALRARLAALGGGDPESGAGVAARRRRAADQADTMADDLERSHPDLPALERRIARAEAEGEEWTMDDEELARIRVRVDTLSTHIEDLIQRAEKLESEVARLQERETVDAVDGAMATLEEEEARLIAERDRAWVLARLVREADRRFRERHQPDVLRRAGRHLAHLTGGRYDRILADEDRDDGLFHVSGPGVSEPTPLAPPLSTGTLEQAYLALRLAIVDHLDQGQERLPLVLDEVLVNWDRARRARGVDTLATLAETRQVFLFTCHRPMADDLAARGARVVDIGG